MYGLSQGTKIGPYVLDAQLGAGGQGSVWRAHHEGTPTDAIALKIIPVRGSPMTMVERVRREAEAMVRLSGAQASVVACLGLVEDPTNGVLGLAMQLVEGRELGAVLKDPRCDAAAREALLLHVARALAYLHQQGIVHRDVKPQNILVGHRFFENPSDGTNVKLVDFGIATLAGNPKPLTEVGTVVGTPAYMPPERIDPMFWEVAQGRPTEDVFAFGVVAYETFFGRHPANVDDDGTLSTYAEKYRQVSRTGAVWPELPPGHRWTAALRGALALKRSDRLADGAAIVSAIAPEPAQGFATARTQSQPSVPPPPGEPRTEIAAIHGAAAAGTALPPPGHTSVPDVGYPAAPAGYPPPPGVAYPSSPALPPVGGLAFAPPAPPRRQPQGGNTALKALIGVIAVGAVVIPALLIAKSVGNREPDDPIVVPTSPPAAPSPVVSTTEPPAMPTAPVIPPFVPTPPPHQPGVGVGTKPGTGGTGGSGSGTVVVGPGRNVGGASGGTAGSPGTSPPRIGGGTGGSPGTTQPTQPPPGGGPPRIRIPGLTPPAQPPPAQPPAGQPQQPTTQPPSGGPPIIRRPGSR